MKNWRKVFTIIWTGQFVSILTSTIVGYAVVLWLSFKTGSAEVLAIGTIAALLPQTLLGPIAGVYIDRWDRKKVMIAADTFIASCTLLLSLVFFLGEPEIWHIYLLLSLRSAGSAFHTPAMQASVPLIAPESELTRIAGVNQMIQSVGNIAGPALAALFITFMDISYILLIDIAGAAVACISLLFVVIPNPEKKAKEEQHVFREMMEGLREITSHKGISYMFLFFVLAGICIMPVSALFPLMTLQHFNGTAFQMGLTEVAWGLGMLCGGLMLSRHKNSFDKAVIINSVYIILGFTFAVSGMLPSNQYAVFVIVTGLGGISATVYYACFTAAIQEMIDPAKLGRVFSMLGSVALLPSMIGLLSTGFLADNIGLTTTFVLSGALMCVFGVISFFIPSLMALGAKTDQAFRMKRTAA